MNHSRTTILGIIGLLGVGVFLSVVYASSTIITDTSISTTNLTVTGTCSGCGGDGNFNSWSLIQDFNSTATVNTPLDGFISNSGNVTSDDNTNSNIVSINGVLTEYAGTIIDKNAFTQHTFSSTGKYSTLQFINGTGTYIKVLKNGLLTFTFKIDNNKFFSVSNTIWEISPDGKYVSLAYKDKCNCGNLRVQIWQGI